MKLPENDPTKSKLIRLLEDMAFTCKLRRSPSVPMMAMPRPKYSDADTNSLAACIQDFLKMRGHHYNRTNTTGTDLNCIIDGRSWQVDLKIGRGKLSEAQIRQRDSVLAVGGLYLVVEDTFQDFINKYLRHTGLTFFEAFQLPPLKQNSAKTSETDRGKEQRENSDRLGYSTT